MTLDLSTALDVIHAAKARVQCELPDPDRDLTAAAVALLAHAIAWSPRVRELEAARGAGEAQCRAIMIRALVLYECMFDDGGRMAEQLTSTQLKQFQALRSAYYGSCLLYLPPPDELPLRAHRIGPGRLPDDVLDAATLEALLPALDRHYQVAEAEFGAVLGALWTTHDHASRTRRRRPERDTADDGSVTSITPRQARGVVKLARLLDRAGRRQPVAGAGKRSSCAIGDHSHS